jgi:hypothetical protein
MAQSTYTSDEMQPAAPEELDATPARQGMRGVHILWVLIISFILAAAALFGSWAFRSGDLSRVEPNTNVKPAAAQSFDGSAGGARQNYQR